jgi:hypothetical protein
MRKLTFAVALIAGLGGASLASAAPGIPAGVSAPDAAVTTVQMTRMERRMMMERRMERRMMRRKMERRMMRREIRRDMMRRM